LRLGGEEYNSGAWMLFITLLHAGFLLGLPCNPEDAGDVPQNRTLTFTTLHGVISQNV
jgi:hypothetical protein